MTGLSDDQRDDTNASVEKTAVPTEKRNMMSRRKTVFGITVLLALALSAFAAASASAFGATMYTCVKGKGVLNGAHCLGTSGGEYGHVEIKQEEQTTGTISNANTATGTTAARSVTLKGILSGVTTEITCKDVHGELIVENRKALAEHYAHAEGRLHGTSCAVKAPAGKGCKVAAETITTKQLTFTTQEAGHTVKVRPKEGTSFTEVSIEGCSVEALNNTFPVTGSFAAVTEGATLTATHTEGTTQNTLKFGGQKAGIDLGLTIKAHSKAGEETNPITFTTTS